MEVVLILISLWRKETSGLDHKFGRECEALLQSTSAEGEDGMIICLSQCNILMFIKTAQNYNNFYPAE